MLDLALLRQRCLGNEELVGQILGKLRSTVTGELERLRVACVEHDFATAARLAHRLKGTAANVEAAGLRQAAERLEAAARLEDPRAVAAAWTPLEEQCRQLGRTAAQYHNA